MPIHYRRFYFSNKCDSFEDYFRFNSNIDILIVIYLEKFLEKKLNLQN